MEVTTLLFLSLMWPAVFGIKNQCRTNPKQLLTVGHLKDENKTLSRLVSV